MANLIYTTYFTKDLKFSQHDSSHGGKGGSKPDDYSLIRNWYESVLKLNIDAVIFHNECSEEFINKHTNDKIKFVKWNKEHRPSYNDERFFCFREYLKDKKIEYVLSTDMFDVKILKNPFQFINKKYDIYIGSEQKNIFGSSSRNWVNKKMKRYGFPIIGKSQIVYNAGICGGRSDNILKFYDIMINKFKKIDKSENANMAVFNQTIRYFIDKGWKVFTGKPFHNVFGSEKIDKDTFIKHK